MNSVNSDDRIRELELELVEKNKTIEKYSETIKELEADLDFRTDYLNKKIDEITASYKKASSDYLEIQNSSSWRMTGFFRNAAAYFRGFLNKHIKFRVLLEMLKSFLSGGPKSAKRKFAELKALVLCSELQSFGYAVSNEEICRQLGTQFSRGFKISIFASLHNTSPDHLKAMIDSVEAQTYTNWELCLSDLSDDQHRSVSKICGEYSRKDCRIKYRKPESGIEASGNLNACVDMTEGEYIAILDGNDVLHPYGLFEVACAISETDADLIYTDEISFINTPNDAFSPVYKPDYAPDSLCGFNYIRHLTVFKRELFNEKWQFDQESEETWDHELSFRLVEKANHIVHIPKILYFVRTSSQSAADISGMSPDRLETMRKAVEAHIERLGCTGSVSVIRQGMPFFKVQYNINTAAEVSILIPNCDHAEDLRKCIDSIVNKTTYPNYEIVIIENNSTSDNIFEYYDHLKAEYENIKVIVWDGPFNYSAINNFGALHCSGEYYLFLNNDTEVITADWIEQMLMYARRYDVGAVGAKLLYPDDTIQHAGIGLGLQDLAAHLFRGAAKSDPGYMGRLLYAQNLSAVTAACMMVSKTAWEKAGGFDELFEVAFNDVDLCMRLRKSGLLVVWTPFAELYHYESKSRGTDDTAEKRKRFAKEYFRFKRLWKKELAEGDPYFNSVLASEQHALYDN